MHKSGIYLFILLFCSCKEKHYYQIDLQTSSQETKIFAENVVSTNLYERDIAIAPDGSEFIYTLGDYRQRKRVMVMMQKSTKGWRSGVVGFSGSYNDIEPFYSPDGTKLFFASDRPVDNGDSTADYNIWIAEKVAGDWTEPEPLDTIINSNSDEFYPSVSNNGNLYFTATRKIGPGREDIFISRLIDGEFQSPEPLDSNINSTLYEFNAFVSPEEDLIVFTSYGRADDMGGGDLYFSRRDVSGKWTQAKHMGPQVNSTKLDYCPFVDFANARFYFTSERDEIQKERIASVPEFRHFSNAVLNGLGNIFYVNIEALQGLD